MNLMPASRHTQPAASAAEEQVLVWDLPVRVFHWLLVLCFAGAWLTAERDSWRLLHVTLGYTMGGLVAFRLLWGLVGTRHARFSSFVHGPSVAVRYLGSLLRGRPLHYAGHNPAGALAIVALLCLAAAVVVSGWATYGSGADGWLEEAHEAAASVMLALVAVHVAGVLASSLLHRENLVRAMIDGRKRATPADAIRSRRRGVAGVLLAAVLVFWSLQWQNAITGDGTSGPAGGQVAARHDDD